MTIALCLSCVDTEETPECAALPEIRWTASQGQITMSQEDFLRWQEWSVSCLR